MRMHSAGTAGRCGILWLGLSCLIGIFAAPPEWSRPVAPVKIVENVYYVGTEDLACYLISDPAGHILINTGLADSAPLIFSNVEKLGFRWQDIKILLTNQGHFDHVAAMAEVQKKTSAQFFATKADAPMISDGGASDPVGGPEYRFSPVKVYRILADEELITLGKTQLKVHLHPGHTPGSVSYSMKVLVAGKPQQVLFANLATIVISLDNPKYPNIVSDLKQTYAKQKKLAPDIWLAGHASQFGLQEKLKTGDFADRKGFAAAVLKLEKRFQQQLQIELGQK
jgi:metallo-beta-lactamase class B